jgi:hypothetical protein
MGLASFLVAGLKEFLVHWALPSLEEVVEEGASLFVQAVAVAVAAAAAHLIKKYSTPLNSLRS